MRKRTEFGGVKGVVETFGLVEESKGGIGRTRSSGNSWKLHCEWQEEDEYCHVDGGFEGRRDGPCGRRLGDGGCVGVGRGQVEDLGRWMWLSIVLGELEDPERENESEVASKTREEAHARETKVERAKRGYRNRE